MAADGGKLHLGFVLPSLTGGGAERVTLTLAAALLERGHRVDLLVGRLAVAYREAIPDGLRLFYPKLPLLPMPGEGELRRRPSLAGAAYPLPLNPAGAAWAWLSLRRRLPGLPVNPKHAAFASCIARYLRRERPQLLLSALQDADIAALYAAELTGRSTPVVASVHISIRHNYTAGQFANAARLYPRAAAATAVSEGVADELRQSFGLRYEAVRTIYNPVPSATIWRLSQAAAAHPWFAAGAPPVILCVGRETPQKDYPTLLEAFGLVRRRIPVRLLLLGSFSEAYQATLRAQARSWGAERDFEVMGFDENPFKYMRRAGLLALSTHYEGLPTTLLEALACGTPVVSSDAPHGPAEILEGGKWGQLAPVGDAPALAQAMLETLQGGHPPPAELRRRAAWFSTERAADAYEELFEKVVEQNRL